MSQITLTVTPQVLTELEEAFGEGSGWTATVTNLAGVTSPHPKTRDEFINDEIADTLAREAVRRRKTFGAATAAKAVTKPTITVTRKK